MRARRRVVLANLPRITSDIVRAIVERQPDLRLVGATAVAARRSSVGRNTR